MDEMKLPVFFHIPKNAGTYINNRCFSFMQQYAAGQNLYHIDLLKDGNIFYRLLCYSKDNLGDEYKRINNTCLTIDFKDFEFGALDIFMIRVADRGFGDYKEDLYPSLPQNLKPYEFLVLREPYDRTLSLFSYISSEQSKHESTHEALGDKSFIDYLNSSQLEGSWLIRKFLKIPNHIPVTEEHFKKTCEILDSILVGDINSVDDCLGKVFRDCYNLDINLISSEVFGNKTKEKTEVPYDNLDDETQNKFMMQTHWDHKIYKKYVNIT